MGHLAGKDIFRELGRKIDGMEVRAPWNEKLRAVLQELYSEVEADLVVKMPNGLSDFDLLVRLTRYEPLQLKKILDGLTTKGLVMDLWLGEKYYYLPNPLVIGIFEFTMMRKGEELNFKEWARLLSDYMQGDDSFVSANLRRGEKISAFRALPHEESLQTLEHVEILDYEKASALIAAAGKFAVGLCSCRHEKLHLGEYHCGVPLEKCTSFGLAAETLIRHNLAREISRSEMEEGLMQSKEMGLMLTADNVRQNVRFICHCCKCCCNVISCVNKFGYPNMIVTSNFLCRMESENCTGCGKCSKVCPVNAISLVAAENQDVKSRPKARVDQALCVGCGVCVLKCPQGSCRMIQREKRVIHPENTFERLILQCLEKGTLQRRSMR